ncbi:MAG: TIGR03087 family PEP-CTERM/XrtA system glycosyltransferase, partial [Gammaproteobacteria bacterium]|nr:TIGR03087 family PEP-CTERM/XrtA system glycosyltransferase [Gammaproteobacteria bacterium]
PTPVPSSMGYFHSRRLQQRIIELTQRQQFDFIIVHSSSVAPYVQHCRDIPAMIDFCDMDSQKWLTYVDWKPFPLNLGYWIEGTKLAAAERRIAADFAVSTVATPAELQSLEEMGTANRAEWFANGVDSEFFCRTRPYKPDGPLVFVGRMDYYPNEKAMLDFCAHNWPALRASEPDLELAIVGAAPTRKVQALAELPGVTVTGYVDDVRPWLERASIAIAPLEIARGTQNKILEAMAMELPVVSSVTAAGGVAAESGHHLETAGDITQFNDAILSLRRHPGRAGSLGTAARAQVLDAHAWSASMQKMQAIVESYAA